MAWAKNGSTTLSSTGDTITVSSLTANKTNQFLLHALESSSLTTNHNLTFNNNSGSVYARRIASNGNADTTSVNRANIPISNASYGEHLIVMYVCSVPNEEKLMMSFSCAKSANGAGNVVSRDENFAKFVPSPDANITRVDINNSYTGDYASGSNLSALGSELTPASATTIETGSIYIDTDTANRWWFDGTYWNMQPTFDNLFSTDNMTHNTSQTAIESGYFRVNHRVGSGADDHAYWDLGTTLSDNWVMRCKFSCTAKSSSASNPNTAGLFSLSASNDNNFSVNGLGFKVSIGGGGNYDNLFFAGGTSNQSGGEGYNFSGVSDFDNINNAGTTKYVEIIKNGTSITMNVYDDEYVTLYDTFTTTHTGTMTGLRYFTYKNRDDIAGSHTETIHIDDLRIYDGVTSVQQ